MERKQSTIDSYARCAWEIITTSTTPLDETDDVDIIQSLAILAVIDATGECMCKQIMQANTLRHSMNSRSTSKRLGEDRNGSTDRTRLEYDARTCAQFP